MRPDSAGWAGTASGRIVTSAACSVWGSNVQTDDVSIECIDQFYNDARQALDSFLCDISCVYSQSAGDLKRTRLVHLFGSPNFSFRVRMWSGLSTGLSTALHTLDQVFMMVMKLSSPSHKYIFFSGERLHATLRTKLRQSEKETTKRTKGVVGMLLILYCLLSPHRFRLEASSFSLLLKINK